VSQSASFKDTIVFGTAASARQGAVPRWFVLTALILAAVLLVPFATTPIPPLLDFPNHVAEMYVIAHAATDPILAKFFSIHWTVVANSGVELVMPILLRWFPLWDTGRVFAMLAVLLPLAGTIAFSRAVFGRWSAWSLGGGLVAYNTLFLLGFMNFIIRSPVGRPPRSASGVDRSGRRGGGADAVLRPHVRADLLRVADRHA
jgi:hypothetical protein